MLSLPSIQRIKTIGKLHFAGRPDVARLLKEVFIADDASSSESGLYSSLYSGSVTEELRNFLAGFSKAFVFSARADSSAAASVGTVIPDTKVIITIPAYGSGISAYKYRLEQVSGASGLDRGPFMTIPPIYQSLADGLLSRSGYDGFGPVVALHPGSGGKAKRWPLENYLGLAARLIEEDNAFVVIFTGDAENDRFKADVDAFARGRLGAAHFEQPELIALAALIERSSLYIGNDSGPTHLAAVIGRPVLALFGPTDSGVWMPAGPDVEIMQVDELARVCVDDVHRRSTALLSRGV